MLYLYSIKLTFHIISFIMKNIAIVYNKGDGLTWMVIAHQLYLNKYNVVVYSDILNEISDWLPKVEIKKIQQVKHVNTK